MKKILLSLMITLMICSVSLAAETHKKETRRICSTKIEAKKNSFSAYVTLFNMHVITFNDDCCDGTTRTSYIVWADGDPLNSVFIPDPRGDCPICPPA